MEKIIYDKQLSIDGMGIILFSKGAVKDIADGEDYFHKDYATPEQVANHLKMGDIVGFCTGSGGDYKLRFRAGYPNVEIDQRYPITIRLAIQIDGGALYFDDLFSLMDWRSDLNSIEFIPLDNGIYHITLCTIKPESGIWGDNQIIYVYLNRLEKMPQLMWTGVPLLFTE